MEAAPSSSTASSPARAAAGRRPWCWTGTTARRCLGSSCGATPRTTRPSCGGSSAGISLSCTDHWSSRPRSTWPGISDRPLTGCGERKRQRGRRLRPQWSVVLSCLGFALARARPPCRRPRRKPMVCMGLVGLEAVASRACGPAIRPSLREALCQLPAPCRPWRRQPVRSRPLLHGRLLAPVRLRGAPRACFPRRRLRAAIRRCWCSPPAGCLWRRPMPPPRLPPLRRRCLQRCQGHRCPLEW